MPRKNNKGFNNLIGGIIKEEPSTPASIDAPHEAEAPETTATKDAAPAQTSTGAKRGRPKTEKTEKRVAVTFQIPESLYYELKVAAAQMRTTQQFIVIDALVDWLDK